MKKIINLFNVSKTISIITNAVASKRFIYSIFNFIVILISCLVLFLSSYLGIHPWANIKLFAQILSIVSSILSGGILILFTIYQVVVFFSNFKAFGEKVLYASLTLSICFLTIVLLIVDIYLILGMY